MPTLWIVHRDAGRRAALARLSGAGEDTILGDPADRLFEGSPPADVVLLGLAGDFEEELEFAHRYAPRLAHARWLLVTEREDEREARRLFDTLDAEIIAFPPTAEGLRQQLRRAFVRRGVEPLSERRARDAVAARFARWFAGLDLPELLRALDPRLARTPVLIRGEHGSGRTLLAHYLHAFGGTTGGALVVISGATDLTAEGLRTGLAPVARSERARRSLTVVLEDVELLSLSLQRELRSWIELEAAPDVSHSAWVRWIGTVSTSPDAPAAVLDAGLGQALAAIPITLPALRESPERIVALAQDAAVAFCESAGSRPRRFGDDALDALAQHPWPGNLRELEAVVARTLAACASDVVTAASLRFESEPLISPAGGALTFAEAPARGREAPPPPGDEAFTRPSELEETFRFLEQAKEAPAAPEGPARAEAAVPEPLQTARPSVASETRRASPAELLSDDALRGFLGTLPHAPGDPNASLRRAQERGRERLADPGFRARFEALVQTDPRRGPEVLARLERFAAFPAPERAPVDLSQFFDALIDEQRPELEARQILLLRELERSQPRVLGDDAQLHFGLEALLRRSLGLVKPRGDLYMASRFHPHGLRGGASIRVLLRFQAAARIAPTVGPDAMSLSETALDLLLVEAIVRAHGGRFTLDDGDGADTVILIDLPAPPL